MSRSTSARAAWERRWEEAFRRSGKLGPKGSRYIEEQYGPIEDEDPYDMEDEWDSP